MDTESLQAACTLLATVTGDGGVALPWGAADVPLLALLPVLLACSAFFSGSETALFGLVEAQRMALRASSPVAGRAVDALLADQRALLVTILLGNTTINVLYFIVSSVLMMRSTAGPVGQTVMAVASLLLIVLAGEIGPKVLATAQRSRFAMLCASPMLTLHRAIAPIRLVLSRGVIAPLTRLAVPVQAPERPLDEDLQALVDLSRHEGVIEPQEQELLGRVLEMRRLMVRDVMTPRVRMAALPHDATRQDVAQVTAESRLTQIPVYEGDLDHVRGILHVKRYLLDESADSVTDAAVLAEARFVPDIASLDQMLDHLRHTGVQSAIVVDEYGGTEGIVSIVDVVEELVGDIVAAEDGAIEPPRLIGLGRWRVQGDMSVYEWAEAFRIDLARANVATLSGFIVERIGRAPSIGDVVEHGTVRIEVEAVERGRVLSALVTQLDGESAASEGEDAP